MADQRPITRINELPTGVAVDDNSYFVGYDPINEEEKYTPETMAGTILKYGIKSVDSIADLFGLVGVDGQQINVTSYYAGWAVVGDGLPKGGGLFTWGSDVHDGGIFIDIARAYPDFNIPAEVTAWYAYSGIDVDGWVRTGDTGIVDPLWFGLDTSGIVSATRSEANTIIMQAILDNTALKPVQLPYGTIALTGSGTSVLTLTKNKSIFGLKRSATIRIDNAGATTDFLRVAITDNGGFLDCRGWQFKNMNWFFNGGGQHGLRIEGGMQIIDAQIEANEMGKGTAVGAYDLYVYDQLSHCYIGSCGFSNAYMKCFDANEIHKCITFGTGVAITYDLDAGVRNNIVRDCTLVNRDGQVHVVDGDEVRIINNQMELAQGFSPPESQGTFSTMVYLEGATRPVTNCIIEDNNFGGGTSLDRLIYIDNADRAVITKNSMISVNVAEVELTANATNCIIKRDNYVRGSIVNPRTDTVFKMVVVDNGVGTSGVRKLAADMSPVNGWGGCDFFKDDAGIVNFLTALNSGSTVVASQICTMPAGFRPADFSTINGVCDAGAGAVAHTTAGVINVKNVASNSGLTLNSYKCFDDY